MSRRKKCIFNFRSCIRCGCMYLIDEKEKTILTEEEEIKMREVIIDEDACVGCGLCNVSLPRVFQIGEDGLTKIKEQDNKDIELKLEVADSCPAQAITLTDG